MIKILSKAENLPIPLPNDVLSNYHPIFVIKASENLYGTKGIMYLGRYTKPFIVNESPFTIVKTDWKLEPGSHSVKVHIEGEATIGKNFMFDPLWTVYQGVVKAYAEFHKSKKVFNLREEIIKSYVRLGEDEKAYLIRYGFKYFREENDRLKIFNLQKEQWEWLGKSTLEMDINNQSTFQYSVIPTFFMFSFTRYYDSWILGPKWSGDEVLTGPVLFPDDSVVQEWYETTWFLSSQFQGFLPQKKTFYPGLTHTGWSGMFLNSEALYAKTEHEPIMSLVNKGITYIQDIVY